jgi:FdhD protein
MEAFEITAVTKDGRQTRDDWVTQEVPFTIEINGREIATLLASPTDLEELVLGFLFTTGLIPDVSAVQSITIDEQRWKANAQITGEGLGEELAFKRIFTSGCGRGVVFSTSLDLINRVKIPTAQAIESSVILDLMRTFLSRSEEHKKTGGVHSAALADPAGIIIHADDIGRHNAVDKVVGRALKEGVVLPDKLLLTSGRISSEILSKTLRCRIPVVISPGAPTDQAVRLAREVDLTLIAHTHGGRMNIYSGPERVLT